MNLLIIIFAGLVSFGVGGIWYSFLFKKQWMEEVGVTEADIQESGGTAFSMVFTLVVEIILAFLVVFLIQQSQLSTYTSVVLIALVAVLSALKNYFFEQKSFKLLAINESYKFICVMIMASSVYFLN